LVPEVFMTPSAHHDGVRGVGALRGVGVLVGDEVGRRVRGGD
jgi:hypothetical protein